MDYTTLTNPQLADECRKRGLPAYGKKPQYIDRLTKHDAAQAPIPEENPVSDNIADLLEGPDLDVLAPPAIPVSTTPAPEVETSQARELAELKAQMFALQSAFAAASGGEKPKGGEPANDARIQAVLNSERVFRAEYQLPKAAALGPELHSAFCAQIADEARDAGYTVRGDGRRVRSGTNAEGKRVEIYEIYARKQ